MLAVRDALLSDKDRRIGYGKEADIFLWENHIWKVFPCGTKEEVIQRNVEFLQKYWPTGHVPRYKQIHSVEYGLIKMEFVDGITLSEFVKTDQAKDLSVRNELLKLLWDARLTLPHDIEFTDFKNSDNIMLKLNAKGIPLNVIFLEGGTEIHGTKGALCLFLEKAADLINARRSPFYLARHATMKQYLQ